MDRVSKKGHSWLIHIPADAGSFPAVSSPELSPLQFEMTQALGFPSLPLADNFAIQ